MKEPLLLTFCSAAAAASRTDDGQDDGQDAGSGAQKPHSSAKSDVGPNMKLDPELYEGVVTQTIIEPSVSGEKSPDSGI